jgi:hypothetical protein
MTSKSLRQNTNWPKSEQKTERNNVVPVEEVHIRNYDLETTHEVQITLLTEGKPVFKKTYRLSPADTRSVVNAVSPGTYNVEVCVDGRCRETGQYRIGKDPSEFVLVEIGNGAVSLTEGLQ